MNQKEYIDKLAILDSDIKATQDSIAACKEDEDSSDLIAKLNELNKDKQTLQADRLLAAESELADVIRQKQAVEKERKEALSALTSSIRSNQTVPEEKPLRQRLLEFFGGTK